MKSRQIAGTSLSTSTYRKARTRDVAGPAVRFLLLHFVPGRPSSVVRVPSSVGPLDRSDPFGHAVPVGCCVVQSGRYADRSGHSAADSSPSRPPWNSPPSWECATWRTLRFRSNCLKLVAGLPTKVGANKAGRKFGSGEFPLRSESSAAVSPPAFSARPRHFVWVRSQYLDRCRKREYFPANPE